MSISEARAALIIFERQLTNQMIGRGDKKAAEKEKGNPMLTSVHDLAEQIFPTEEILGGTIPSTIAKLMLALCDRLIRAPGHGHQHSWIFSGQPALLSPQGRVHCGIHVKGGWRHWQKIVRLSCLRDSPGKKSRPSRSV